MYYDPINDLLPVITISGTDSPQPTPRPRGSSILPAWFRVHESGWYCHHPHDDPETVIALSRLPTHWVNRSAIDHLDAHHPGWKLPCRHCKRPQWNEVGSTYCYDCRPR